jgi:predicted lysophospholipase L1 biosynthesis ABC-type transport system permease subunit
VRRLLLAEGAILAIVGGLVGAAAGLAYTRALLYGLATVWQGAVGSADIRFYADPVSVAGGTAAGFIVALAAVWLSVRRQARAPARELLAAGAEAELRMALPRRARPWVGAALAAVGIVGAVAILALPNKPHGEEAAGLFFGAGALLLVAGLGICQTILARMAPAGRKAHARFSGLAVRNATRRRGRSLATIALLACGVFMIITVAAFRKDPLHEAAARSSGTGGFALYGETTMPITQDLNSGAGLQAYALPEDFLGKVAFVPMRVHEGDEASCLNLNRPQTPRLWGVDPQLLASRGAFTFVDTIHPATGSPWALLDEPLPDGAVPAIVDQTTLTWALGKSVGDTIPYTDEQGRTFEIQIVAALENSILQGGLVISEQNLLEKFPSTSGYRAMLVDAPPDEAAKVSADLSEQLSDVGLSLVPAAERLAAFNTVENTYLAIFQALGGLALALGSIGLGVVVLRNVLERRSELALLRAVGFPRRKLYWMVLSEHWALLALGLACGVAASLGAVLPLVESLGTQVPYLSLAVMLAAVLAAGLLWTYLATRLALRGPLLEALRSE